MAKLIKTLENEKNTNKSPSNASSGPIAWCVSTEAVGRYFLKKKKILFLPINSSRFIFNLKIVILLLLNRKNKIEFALKVNTKNFNSKT